MEQELLRKVISCDFCGAQESYMQACDNCGKDICYECKKRHAHIYAHAVHFSGSGDALYCNECDSKMFVIGDVRHAKFVAIERLRNEEKAYWEDFKVRAKSAEDAVKHL
jgi:hypothetical protein